MSLRQQIGNDRLPLHPSGTGIEITDQHERFGSAGDGLDCLWIAGHLAAIPGTDLITLLLRQERRCIHQIGVEDQHRAGHRSTRIFEIKPGLTDRRRIGPIAQQRSVLTVECFLLGQRIDALQQCRSGQRRLCTRALGPGFIEGLSDGRLVLFQLLKGTLERRVGIGGLGHGGLQA